MGDGAGVTVGVGDGDGVAEGKIRTVGVGAGVNGRVGWPHRSLGWLLLSALGPVLPDSPLLRVLSAVRVGIPDLRVVNATCSLQGVQMVIDGDLEDLHSRCRELVIKGST